MTDYVVDDKIVMLSFPPLPREEVKDLTKLIEWKLWITCGLIVLPFLAIAMLLRPSGRVRSKLRLGVTSFWASLGFILNQNFPAKHIKTYRIIGASLALLVLFTWIISGCIMNTDLVISDKPFQIDTLEDVLDPRASESQLFWREFSNFHLFLSESSSPVKQKIYKKVLSSGLEKRAINLNFLELMQMSNQFPLTSAIFFLMQGVADFTRAVHCSGVDMGGNIKLHIGKEAVARDLFGLYCNYKNDSCKNLKRSNVNKR